MSKKASAFPKARRFAVVRMDPVAMVEHLQDPLATNAARAMRPKKYLVYLEFPQDLPMPDSSYCRYRVNAVAARLRPPVPEKGITRDMVVPIYPNTHRARDDVKIASTPVFPFSNCYFWIDARMSLRVRVSRNREYENDSAYQLDISQHVALSDAFEHDFARINQFWRERPTAYVEGLEAHMDGVFSTALSSLDTDEFAFEDDHMSSDSSLEPDPLLNATPPIPPSITDILSMNVFGWDDDPSFQFIPLVDLWLDLKEHLSEDSIPNPVGLWKEQEWVGVIIKDSLERRKRTQLQRSLSAWDRANYSLPVSDPSISEHARNRKPRSRGRDGDRAQQQRSSVAANPSTTTRPGPVPQRRPPTTLTLDYRSWSGDIRYEEPVFPLTPHLEKLSQAEKDDPLPQSAPKALAQPVPTYCPLGDAHATPTTPPPSYASLFKNAGVPAPRPTQGSRAAVWPSRHPSPVLRIAVALDSQHSRGPAAASLRPIELRAAEEARRIQQNYRILQLRARGPDSSPRVPTSSSSQSSSNRLVLVHSYSYSVVQTVQGHGRSRDRGPTTSPEEGWLPVKERVVPSRADPSRTGPAEASSRVLQADATQLRREMRQLDVRLQTAAARTKQHLKLEQPGHRSRSEGLRVDSERGPTPSGKDVASSNANPRRRGPVVDPW